MDRWTAGPNDPEGGSSTTVAEEAEFDIRSQDLRFFLSIAAHQQLSAAAREANIGQPGIGKRMAILERAMGVQLMARSPRGVQLTDAGQRVLPKVREVVALLDQLPAVAKDG